jgi:hypothetical protein
VEDKRREHYLYRWDCFVAYVEVLREARKRERIKIADGVYAPSPDEAACIKQRFLLYSDIARAHAECGDQDILSDFGLEMMSNIIRNDPKEHMYDVIKTVYRMTRGITPTPPDRAVNHHVLPAEKKDYTLYYVAVALATAILLGRIL